AVTVRLGGGETVGNSAVPSGWGNKTGGLYAARLAGLARNTDVRDSTGCPPDIDCGSSVSRSPRGQDAKPHPRPFDTPRGGIVAVPARRQNDSRVSLLPWSSGTPATEYRFS